MIDNFAGKTAVLTGAGSGFGLECARIGARLGMNLVLVDVQQDALDAAAAEMQAAGSQVLARKVDVSNAAQMEQLAADVQQRFGAPHLVFNNAGVGAGGLVWENSVKDWEWVLGVNLMGRGARRAPVHPHDAGAAKADPAWRGHIVNTASMAGLLNAPNMGIYNVSKHAVVSCRNAVPGPVAGHRPDRRQRAVPVLCAHRHQPEPPQPPGDLPLKSPPRASSSARP
jgi:NAD(P)-dependent dehydrogenase (short-subunit alcohol dehydrogenase family)